MMKNKKRQLQQIEDGQEEASSIHALHLNDLREQIKHQLYQQQNELTQIKNKAQLEVLHVRRELSQVVSKKTLDIVEHQDIMITHRPFPSIFFKENFEFKWLRVLF